jgi:hypothetical protein
LQGSDWKDQRKDRLVAAKAGGEKPATRKQKAKQAPEWKSVDGGERTARTGPTIPKTATSSKDKGRAKEIFAQMVVKPQTVWYEVQGSDLKADEPAPIELVGQLQRRGAELLLRDTKFSEEVHTITNKSEEGWMKSILQEGTLGDRLAAW